MATKAQEDITARITEALAQGTVPWTQPWVGGSGVARNLKTKKAYRGLNVLLLALSPHAGRWFVTFKQAKAMGGTVRGGEHGTKLYFWMKWCFKHKCDARRCHGAHKREDQALIQKGFTVFNAATQCDGLNVPAENTVRRDVCGGYALGFKLLDLLDRGGYELPVSEDGEQAWYHWGEHRVNLPPCELFHDARGYYQTALHELGHSTGKELDRKVENPFGSTEYAREELTAEMTACLGMIELGTEPDIDNSAAYCADWMRKLEDDPGLVSIAAGRAAKALTLLFDGDQEDAS